MPDQSNIPPTLNPDDLLAIIGASPADNIEGFDTAVLWNSEIVGRQVKGIYDLKRILGLIEEQSSLFGPLSFTAGWQKNILQNYVTQPVETFTRILGATGQGPDQFIQQNVWIEETYAHLLHERCSVFIKNGTFDRVKAKEYTESEEGRKFLENTMREFAMLEKGYHSRGMTLLKALKELLKCFVMVVTEQAIEKGELPFKPRNKDDFDSEKYLDQIRSQLENLHRANAFEIKTYSEKATGGKIGYSRYEIVENSQLYASSLRYYPLPKGIKANGKILYLPSPLVNKPEVYDLDKGKSVIEGFHKAGYIVYMVDNGDPGYEESKLGLVLRQRNP